MVRELLAGDVLALGEHLLVGLLAVGQDGDALVDGVVGGREVVGALRRVGHERDQSVRDDLEARRFLDRDAGDGGAARRRRERSGRAQRGRYEQDLGEAFFHFFAIAAVSCVATRWRRSMVQ